MIVRKSFNGYKSFNGAATAASTNWEEVRRQAERFVQQLPDRNVIAITESTMTCFPFAINVTVWYRDPAVEAQAQPGKDATTRRLQ